MVFYVSTSCSRSLLRILSQLTFLVSTSWSVELVGSPSLHSRVIGTIIPALMPLAPGTQLGPYQILALLGAGGMGEVYKAKDTRLDRFVAVKVLPEAFTDDGDRRLRFEHEAHVLSSLSHPNLLAVFDVGTHTGQYFIVSELLTGSSLRAVLSDHPLSLRRSVEYALQIARG